MTVRELKDALADAPDDAEIFMVACYPPENQAMTLALDFHVNIFSPSCAHPVLLQRSERVRYVPTGGLEYTPSLREIEERRV